MNEVINLHSREVPRLHVIREVTGSTIAVAFAEDKPDISEFLDSRSLAALMLLMTLYKLRPTPFEVEVARKRTKKEWDKQATAFSPEAS